MKLFSVCCATLSAIGAGLLANGVMQHLQDCDGNALRARAGSINFYYSHDVPNFVAWGIGLLVLGVLTYVFGIRGDRGREV